MAFFKITQHRSAIGLPQRTRAVLAALGLRKRCQTVYQPVSRDSAGMIMKVKELVRVEEVDRALSKAEMRALRKPDPGYYIETPAPRLRDPAAAMGADGDARMGVAAAAAEGLGSRSGSKIVEAVAAAAAAAARTKLEEEVVDYAALL